MIPSLIHDQLWHDFRKLAADEEKLCGSPVEWKEAYLAWRTLDPFQKAKAIDYLRDNDGMQVTHVTPIKYIRNQIFLRPAPRSGKRQPVRAAPPPQAPPQCPRCRDFGYLPRGNWRIPPDGATAAEIRANCVACECAAGAEQARIWREE